ncbi:MAG: hypothetical protein ACSHX9_10355 [Luteolibacter sp.]
MTRTKPLDIEDRLITLLFAPDTVNPMFVDQDDVDFRFKLGSQVEKIGIKEIDISKTGLQSGSN